MPIGAIIGGLTAVAGGVGSLIGGNNAQGEIRTGLNTATTALAPFQQTGVQANNLMASLLGLGGGSSHGSTGGIFNSLTGTGLSSPGARSAVAGGRSYDQTFNGAQPSEREFLPGRALSGFGGGNRGFGVYGAGGGGGFSGDPLQTFFNSAGGKFILGRGSDAITANKAASGLLNSGSTLKDLTTFGMGVGSTFFQNFLSNLSGLSGQGLNAGIGVANAATGAATQLADREVQKVGGITQGITGALGAIPTG